MSCIPYLECGDGTSVTREDLDRWTDSLTNLLGSAGGRSNFKEYLEARALEESLCTLDFYEQCSRLISRISDGGDSPPPSTASTRDPFSSQSSALQCAPDGNVARASSSSTLVCLTPAQRPTSQPQKSEDIKKDLTQLVEFASDNVNFDIAQMRKLYEVLNFQDGSKIKEVLLQSQQQARELLLDHYQLFRKHLLQKMGP